MTKLTDHFTLEEFVLSQTASRKGIDNTPSADVTKNLKKVAATLEEIRTLLGEVPIHVNSGYRSPALNKAVGGAKTSAHMDGYAADFIAPAYGSPLKICKTLLKSAIAFDQIIEEGTWVHISVAPAMRNQVLTKIEGGYATGLRKS